MKVKLVYPPSWIRFSPTPPLGIAVLSSGLRQAGYEVEQQDMELECWLTARSGKPKSDKIDLKAVTDHDRVEKYLISGCSDPVMDNAKQQLLAMVNPDSFDVLCFSIMGLNQLSSTALIAYALKECHPSRPVVIGGQLVDTYALDILRKYRFVDYAIVQRGYESLELLLRVLSQNGQSDISMIPGLVYRERGKKVRKNTISSSPTGTMPTTDFHGLLLLGYKKQLNDLYRNHFDSLLLQYPLFPGCPKRCTFCERIITPFVKPKYPRDLASELELIMCEYGVADFSMICNEINPTEKWAREFVEELLRRKLELQWYVYARPASLSDETIELLSEAGCKMLHFGVESGSQAILDSMRKGLMVHEIERILRTSHEKGIWNQVNFIVGYPYESDRDVRETIGFIERNAEFIHSVRLNPLYISTNSLLYARCREFQIRPFWIDRSHIGFDEIEGLKWEDKKKKTIESIDSIYESLKRLGIGFHGVSSELLFTSLVSFKDRFRTKKWLSQVYPFMLDNLSFEEIRWRIYHCGEQDTPPYSMGWDQVCGKTYNSYMPL